MIVTTKPTAGDTRWFVNDRFGMFVHWGLYALPARNEWTKQREEIPDESYDTYFRHLDPDLYNPDLWARAAANAGMKYFVITTKHHDGFCLWDTRLTDYKAPNTPCGRDLLRPMVDAFRRQNLRIGFYHSLIDWHHPEFVIDDLHAMRNHPDRAELNKKRDQGKYAAYLHGQVRELLTQFGGIDILWFDFSYPTNKERIGKGRDDWQSAELYRLVRELAPHIILNDRLDLENSWDMKTPEQCQPREWLRVDRQPVVWEACQTFSGSWGYNREEAKGFPGWKSVEQLIQMLIDTVSKGGNLLLNVGPTGRGELDQRELERLEGMGEWMKRHSRSIYGCTQAPDEFAAPQDCRLTYNPKTRRLYAHVFTWPFRHLHLDGIAGKVEYAQLLNDASEIKITEPEERLRKTDAKAAMVLNLPVHKPPVTVPVIEMFLK